MTELDKIGFEIEGEWSSDFQKAMSVLWGFSFHGDGSVHGCGTKKCAPLSCMEANSVPYSSHKVGKLKELFDLMQIAWDNDKFHANTTAGFHVHTSYVGFPSEILSARFSAYFMDRMAKKFPDEYAKRSRNHYCRVPADIERAKNDLLKKAIAYKPELVNADYEAWSNGDRYRAVNIRASWNERKTVEFRIFPATEPKRMYEMLLFTVQEVERYLKNAVYSFDFKERIENNSKKVVKEKIELVTSGEKIGNDLHVGDTVRFINDYQYRIPQYYYEGIRNIIHGSVVIGSSYAREGAKVMEEIKDYYWREKGKKESVYRLAWKDEKDKMMSLAFRKKDIKLSFCPHVSDIEMFADVKGNKKESRVIEINGYVPKEKDIEEMEDEAIEHCAECGRVVGEDRGECAERYCECEDAYFPECEGCGCYFCSECERCIESMHEGQCRDDCECEDCVEMRNDEEQSAERAISDFQREVARGILNPSANVLNPYTAVEAQTQANEELARTLGATNNFILSRISASDGAIEYSTDNGITWSRGIRG